MKIIVPVKDDSSRLPNKNFTEFYDGKSLTEIKIEQLLERFNPTEIVMVVDGPKGYDVANRYGLSRLDDSDFNKRGYHEAVRFWYDRILDDDCIMLTYVTLPMFNLYAEVLKAWDRSKYDSIFSGSHFRHYMTDNNGRPLNFQMGYHHMVSQTLPKWVQMDWGCEIIDGRVAREALYSVGRSPQIFIHSTPFVDIDIEEDFELAQWYYANKTSKQ